MKKPLETQTRDELYETLHLLDLDFQKGKAKAYIQDKHAIEAAISVLDEARKAPVG